MGKRTSWWGEKLDKKGKNTFLVEERSSESNSWSSENFAKRIFGIVVKRSSSNRMDKTAGGLVKFCTEMARSSICISYGADKVRLRSN